MKGEKIVTQHVIASLTANNCAKLDAIVNAMRERAQSGDVAALRFMERFKRLAEHMRKNAEQRVTLADTMARTILEAGNSDG